MGCEVIAALRRAGFSVDRTVVPVHASETIGPGLLAKIIRDCELTAEQLRELIR